MKSIICLTCFLVCMACATHAQIKKGAIFLGGNLSASTLDYHLQLPPDDTKRQHTLTIRPVIGKAIKENLIAGIMLSFAYSSSDNIGNATASKTNEYSGSLFLRKYKFIGSGFSLFGETDLGFGTGLYVYYRDTQTEKTKGPGFSLTLFPGISYSVNKKLQLEAAFNDLFHAGYTHEKKTRTDRDNKVFEQSTMNYFQVRSSLESLKLSVGFRLLINK